MEPRIVTEFSRFDRLTSVHVNSTDDHMLVSGYTYGVTLFDISTGKVCCLVRFFCLSACFPPREAIFSALMDARYEFICRGLFVEDFFVGRDRLPREPWPFDLSSLWGWFY